MDHVEVVVIGAGVAGSAAAWALGRRGVETVLLEQYELGHPRGSSHGPTRLFRRAYPQPDYVRLAMQAVESWRQLEDEAGEQLLLTTGGLYAGGWAEECAEALDVCGSSYEWLLPAAAAERYPAMSFDGLDRVLWQEDGGVCLAERTVAAQARLAAEAGVHVRPKTPVSGIRAAEGGVEVDTPAGALRADVCVIAAGAYAGPLLAEVGIELPLRPAFAQVTYFEPAGAPGETPPGFVEAATVDGGLASGGYWVPSVDGSGLVKAGDGAAGAGIDPHQAPFPVDSEEESWVAEFVRRRLPAYEPRPLRSETCIYTMTPDEDFFLDRRGRVVVASPCSGHGFKFGPLLGEILADLATGDDPELPEGRFTMERLVP